jgi:hypothetical protein
MPQDSASQCALSQASQRSTIGLATKIRRPEPALGAFRRHVEQDGVRLPEDEFAILEGRHLPVGIEGQILGSELVATTEIDRFELAIESKMILECDDGQHARRWWKEIELHYKSFLEEKCTSCLTG